MIKLIFLMLLTRVAVAQDTVWVETTYQRIARQRYEQTQKEYEMEAESLNRAISIIRMLRATNNHGTSLEQIIDGQEESKISLTRADKTNYLFKLNARKNELKPLYEKNQLMLDLLELNRKSGEFYILDKKLSDKRKNMTAKEVDAFMLIKEGSPTGQYYDWGDWLYLFLAQNIKK